METSKPKPEKKKDAFDEFYDFLKPNPNPRPFLEQLTSELQWAASSLRKAAPAILKTAENLGSILKDVNRGLDAAIVIKEQIKQSIEAIKDLSGSSSKENG